jgi:hypothetical protein
MRVSDLIDNDSGWWKVSLIQDLFPSSDAEAICNLALSPLRSLNKLIWIGTSNGCFSVKSAYHQEMARRVQDKGESSNHKEATEVWNQIWKLPIQGVVKNFIWKFCSNALPTKDALHRRHIVSDPVYPVCRVGNFDMTRQSDTNTTRN